MPTGKGYVGRHDPTESPIARIGLELAFVRGTRRPGGDTWGPLEWISLGEKHEVSNTFSLFDLVSIVAKEREAEEAKLIEGDVKKLER